MGRCHGKKCTVGASFGKRKGEAFTVAASAAQIPACLRVRAGTAAKRNVVGAIDLF
jgi:hypothetical protein